MTFSHARRCTAGVAVGLALAFFASACGDSTAPTFSDPGAISADLQQVEESFNSATYESFSNLSAFMAPGGGPVASAILGAMRPDAVLEREQPRAAAAAKSLRAMIPQLSSPALGPIVDDTLYGRVFVWDEGAGYYVYDDTQTGPANGVRFVVYAVDPFTGLPSSPLTAVGRVDILDESDESSLTLRVLLHNSDGTVTYVDYTASVTPETSSFSASVAGFVSNGQSGLAARTLDFDIAFAASETDTTGDVSADATFDLANSSVSLEVHDDIHVAGNATTFTRDFRLHRPAEVVTVAGDITITEIETGFTITGQITFRINGEVFVSVTFDGTNAVPSREINEQEQAVVLVLLNVLENVWDSIEDFFDPLNLFAA